MAELGYLYDQNGMYQPGDLNPSQWVLNLNDMRFSHIEELIYVCWANSLQELQDFVNRETVEPYQDGKWGKVFRKFGPLEWYNQPWDHNFRMHYFQPPPTIVVHGIFEFRSPLVVNLPTIEDLVRRAEYENPNPPTRFERITFNLVE